MKRVVSAATVRMVAQGRARRAAGLVAVKRVVSAATLFAWSRKVATAAALELLP